MIFFFTAFFFQEINFLEAATVKKENTEKTISRLLAHEHVKGEIIVRFKRNIAADKIALENASHNAHSRAAAVLKRQFNDLKGVELVKLPENKSMKNALRSYLINPDIEYAEPNYIVHADLVPDDPYFSNLWGLHNTGQTGGTNDADIDAPEAWSLTTGSRSVVIAIVDTGLAFNHPDLNGNIWTNVGETDCTDGIDNDGNGYIDDCHGWDFVGDDNDPTDYNGHGTHVTGTIAATGNNGAGITGVMWKAQIMPLRFLGITGSGTTADAISAILYANANGAHVINNSWGGGGFSQALKDTIDVSGAVVVCAAGNSSTNNDSSPHYPSNYSSPNIIAVAATDHKDNMASFSNYGATSVDVGAPGISIYSTIPQLSYGSPVTVYGTQNFNSVSGNLPLSGWDRGGTNSTWAITAGSGVSGTNSLEDSPGGNYTNNTASWAGYMTPVTSVKDNYYTLTFKWKGNIETNYDYFDINYSLDGVKWTWVDYRTGTTGGSFTSDSTAEFTDIAEMYNMFYFGFGMSTDTSIIRDGVYIDDVKLIRQQLSISNFSYTSYNGTSMATPHVSGVAGLIKAINPALTNIEIKNAILNNVDAVSSLSGKVLTGGRINAFKALSSVFVDSDGDGIADSQDNCSLTANPLQQDTNNDGYGNICDADLDNDGVVGFQDFNVFKVSWLSTSSSPNWNPDADLDSDNVVGFQDFNVFKGRWLTVAPWK